jgi:predicted RNase H-like HicB family nuclease
MYNLPLTLLKNSDWTYTVISNIFNIVTQWDTLEEAIANWKEALACHIEWLEKTDSDFINLNELSWAINTSVLI